MINEKQALLAFIQTYVTDEKFLYTYEYIVGTTEESMMNEYDRGTKTWSTSKENMLFIIENYFNDELRGKTGAESKITLQIENWSLVGEEPEER